MSSPRDVAPPVAPDRVPAILATLLDPADRRYIAVAGGAPTTTAGALQTAGWQAVAIDDNEPGKAVHLLLTASPEAAAAALAQLDAAGSTPWFIVVQASAPATIGSHRHVLFDGQNDYFAAVEHLPLMDGLAATITGAEQANESIRRWRGAALDGWNTRGSVSDTLNAAQELINIKQTLSWRVTRPLRAVRGRVPAGLPK